jgi:RES domain-containing protein
MTAYRIGASAYPLLSGAGAAGNMTARWNSVGRFVIYCAEHYATALVETIVQLTSPRIPRTFAYIRIDVDETAPVEVAQVDDLPDWESDRTATQRFGDRWYDEQRSLVLLVPSLVAPGLERNVLINERHPAFASVRASRPAPVLCHPKLLV